jgi:hypothetical protein
MRDQNGNPVYKDVRRSAIDGLWYTNVFWGGGSRIPVTMVRRYGYHTRAEARDGDISTDHNVWSMHEPSEGVER